MTRHLTTRLTAATAASILFVGAGAAWWPTSASASPVYDAFARAIGVEATLDNESIPTGITIEGIGPEADAHQTSDGVGDASASTPYAGSSVPGLLGLGASLFGFSAPPYPFIATSSRGGEPQTTSYPGVTLQARSQSSTTTASGFIGMDAVGVTAFANTDADQNLGSVTSLASIDAKGLALGQVATLSGVSTVAQVAADDSGLRRTTHTSIARISVPSLVLRIPEQSPGQVFVPIPIPGVPNTPPVPVPVFPVPSGGVTLANPDLGVTDGQFTVTMPVDGKPTVYALPTQPVLDALKAAGITMTYHSPTVLKTGLVSGSYTFAYTMPAPPPNAGFNGPTRVTQSLGKATALVDLVPVGAPQFGAGAADGASGNSADAAGAPGAVVDQAAADGLLPSTSGVAGEPLGSIAAGNLTGDSVLTVGNVELTRAYLVFVAVAATAFAAATALRLIGVRSRWTS